MPRQRCTYVWMSRDGQWHACAASHDPTIEHPVHRCGSGHSIHPGRVHPSDHAAKVAENARARHARTLETADCRGLPWSTADDSRLEELWLARKPRAEIAAELGRTDYGVKARLKKLFPGGLRPGN